MLPKPEVVEMTQNFFDEHDFDQYDISNALEGSDSYDVVQG